MNGIFYTVEEFSEKIKMCPHTVRRAIKSGRIMACRPGIGIKSPYRIHESELMRIMAADYEEMQKYRKNIELAKTEGEK